MTAAERAMIPRLAVIGGGQAAKAILFAVAEAAAAGRLDWRGVEIVVLERGEEFGVGLAWSRRSALPEHISSLSSPQPRVVYGDGQKRQVEGCVALLADLGVRVQLSPLTEVIALSPAASRWRLRTAGGETLFADAVALATGHWDGPPAVPGALRPWPAHALQAAHVRAGGGRVRIVGAGLTAVDAAITLAVGVGRFERRPDGRFVYAPARPLAVTLVSRSGCLPRVWGAPPPPNPGLAAAARTALDAIVARAGRLPLAAALDVFARAAEEAGLPVGGTPFGRGAAMLTRLAALATDEAARAADPIATLAADLAAVLPDGGPVSADRLKALPEQAFLLGLLPIVSETFHALDADDYAVFQARLRGPFYRRAMPMGLDSALRIQALVRAGVLSVRRYADAGSEPADLVVDATGQTPDIARRADPLWQGLLAGGFVREAVRPDREGRFVSCGGIAVDPRTRRAKSARAAPPLYAMGAATLGLFVDAQGIGHVQRDAAEILADLDACGFAGRRAVPVPHAREESLACPT